MATLLEAYSKRLAISESVYSKSHNEAMPSHKKLVIAKCLDNTSKFMNEAFENSVGTQRANLGDFKKFTLNLVTVALPDLIAFDLVMVQPMSSMTGYIAYVQYTSGSNKGETTQGEVFNDPFRLGKVDVNYTSERVVETVKVNSEGKATLAWFPIVNTETVKPEVVGATGVTITVDDAKTGAVTLAGSGVQENAEFKVRYVYDNITIPQNDLPILSARMKNIPVTTKTRRIAIYYSQIANFQAKTDYGFNLDEQLAAQAVGQLNYAIDTEIVETLAENAKQDNDLVFSKTPLVGVSLQEHYASFTAIVEAAKQKIYKRTKRYAPTYMVVSSDVMPILAFVKDFNAAPTTDINGPYYAVSLGGLKVFVSPSLEENSFFFGVNKGELYASAIAFCPYMPIVPTQALGYSDGGIAQGFSTVYATVMLNKDLLVAGRVCN